MKQLQLILDAILSKNTFEYILIDKKMNIIAFSEGVENYSEPITMGEEIYRYFPELIGYEKEIEDTFQHKSESYTLETIAKNSTYINTSIEYYSPDIVMILLHNITDTTLTKQKLLQSSNESILLNEMLEKILDKQNALLLLCHKEKIIYANQRLIDYFDVKNINAFIERNLLLYHYYNEVLESYTAFFDTLNGEEKYIVINNDTFIIKGTLIQSTHILFTLTKVTQHLP